MRFSGDISAMQGFNALKPYVARITMMKGILVKEVQL
jgi:hypothetical protein